ncbi:MAG: phosphatidylserine decarboxylase [Bdellovibrio sp.]|nr:MAG: phosphatidylserine decarboxylase [Bdellovibrio sp.]
MVQSGFNDKTTFMSWVNYLLYLIPKKHLSHLVGWLVHLRLPAPFSQWSVKWFQKHYKINMEEAEKPLSEYQSIGELFVRRLKAGARPVCGEIIHPVDGVLTLKQKVTGSSLIQAKGKSFSLNQFLKSEEANDLFGDGISLTYYLCPRDYHRTHVPLSAEIFKVQYVKGALWPVNTWSVHHQEGLFVKNERVIVWCQSSYGMYVYVMVGATNVGKITLSFDPHWKNQDQVYQPPFPVKTGDEMGVFHMGSTVIVIYDKNHPLPSEIHEGPVKVGEKII